MRDGEAVFLYGACPLFEPLLLSIHRNERVITDETVTRRQKLVLDSSDVICYSCQGCNDHAEDSRCRNDGVSRSPTEEKSQFV